MTITVSQDVVVQMTIASTILMTHCGTDLAASLVIAVQTLYSHGSTES